MDQDTKAISKDIQTPTLKPSTSVESKKHLDGTFMDENGVFYSFSKQTGNRQYISCTLEMDQIDQAVAEGDFATAYNKLQARTDTQTGTLFNVVESWIDPIYYAASENNVDFINYILKQYSYYTSNTILTTKLKYAYDCLIEFKRIVASCLVIDMAARRKLVDFFKWLTEEPRYATMPLKQRSEQLAYIVPVFIDARNIYMANKWCDFIGIPRKVVPRY